MSLDSCSEDPKSEELKDYLKVFYSLMCQDILKEKANTTSISIEQINERMIDNTLKVDGSEGVVDLMSKLIMIFRTNTFNVSINKSYIIIFIDLSHFTIFLKDNTDKTVVCSCQQ